ncbi:MAG TPA: plastocyanin/azurin family copper-binding protein [Solirubrobacteraceae bacterium]|nr:plastocyanin/azurin family copper-binding protein [Solirubrobacteraceae bacterium]
MRLSTARQASARRTPMFSLLALVAVTAVLAGCGSSKETSSSASTPAASTPATTSASTPTSTTTGSAPASGSLSLAANPEGQLKYNTSTLTANAGKVSIDFTNMSPLEHNVTIESASHAVVGATPTFKGESKTLSVTLKPGTYKFYCSVPGHRMAGMEGTLVVK